MISRTNKIQLTARQTIQLDDRHAEHIRADTFFVVYALTTLF